MLLHRSINRIGFVPMPTFTGYGVHSQCNMGKFRVVAAFYRIIPRSKYAGLAYLSCYLFYMVGNQVQTRCILQHNYASFFDVHSLNQRKKN